MPAPAAVGPADLALAPNSMQDTVKPSSYQQDMVERRSCPSLTRLLILGVLLGVLVFVIVDQVLKPCVVTETASQNATGCSESDDCRPHKACASVFLDAFIDWVTEEPAAGAVLLAAVYVVAAVCFVPGSILTLGAGAAFSSALGLHWGVVVGTISVWVGAAVGGLVAFALGRFVLHRLVQRQLRRWKLTAALDGALRDEGLKLMVLLRLSTLIPFNALNYVLAGSSVSASKYAMALPAMLPATIAYVYLGASVAEAARSGAEDDGGEAALRIVLLVVGLVVTFAAVIALSVYAKRQLRKHGLGSQSTGLGEGGGEGEEVEVPMQAMEGGRCREPRALT